jgi:MFS family permease
LLAAARALPARVFASLGVRNYRIYFVGQSVSLVGTWMHAVAQGWLVLELTGSATMVGVVTALQAGPILLVGPYGGLVADRIDKRRLMIALQSLMAAQALVMGALVVTGVVRLWHVVVLALLLGVTNAFDGPARHTIVLEMVEPDLLRNAVSLNSVTLNLARVIGPSIAGVVIAAGGIGWCFLANAVSFISVVASLLSLRVDRLRTVPPARRRRGQLREGLLAVRHSPDLGVPIAMMALIGCFVFVFPVSLPIVAAETFAGGAQAYGFLMGAMGVGAIVGGLYVAARGRTGLRALVGSSFVFGVSMGLAAAAPTLTVEMVALAVVGGVGMGFLAKANSSLQLAAPAHMRSRVMALWSAAAQGTTPIGAPVVGAIAEAFGGRMALAVGALACFGATGIGLVATRRRRAGGSTAPEDILKYRMLTDRRSAQP